MKFTFRDISLKERPTENTRDFIFSEHLSILSFKKKRYSDLLKFSVIMIEASQLIVEVVE